MNIPINLGKSSVQIQGSFNIEEPVTESEEDHTVENDSHGKVITLVIQ